MRIDRTRQQVAEYFVAEIDAWLKAPAQSRTVYLTDKAGLGTYCDIPPEDHLSDLFTISDWDFGPRKTLNPHDPLTSDEICFLTQEFAQAKAVEVALNPFNGVREELYYSEDMAQV